MKTPFLPFLLVTVMGGDITTQRFGTLGEAKAEMHNALCEASDGAFQVENAPIDDTWYLDDFYEVGPLCAWCHSDHDWAWKICDLNDIKKPFILVSVVEEQITMQSFDTHAEAKEQMKKELEYATFGIFKAAKYPQDSYSPEEDDELDTATGIRDSFGRNTFDDCGFDVNTGFCLDGYSHNNYYWAVVGLEAEA
jgi:hypothetical protein